MQTIFEYINPSEYLTNQLEEKKSKNSNFSLRSWAQQMGFKSHGPLHHMLSGRRNIPKKYIPFFIQSLKLKTKEAKYFEAMIDFQRAKDASEKEMYYDRLKEIAPGEIKDAVEVESFKYISNPLHYFILEMTELKNFKYNLGWIKQHLYLDVSLKDIEDVINRLLTLGFLIEKDGVLSKTEKLFTTKADFVNEGVQEYHKNVSLAAISQIKNQTVDERDFSSFSFNIKNSDLCEIKETLKEFTFNIMKEYEAKSKEGDETYHLNLHFFGVSKK
jgi:uncharacterized protein (TIGR02147 family)